MQSDSTNFVCKDNLIASRSFCCPENSTSRECQRDYCSTNANTTSMKLYACPYESHSCSTETPNIVVQAGKNSSVKTTRWFE